MVLQMTAAFWGMHNPIVPTTPPPPHPLTQVCDCTLWWDHSNFFAVFLFLNIGVFLVVLFFLLGFYSNK